jgi:hypothetical protein
MRKIKNSIKQLIEYINSLLSCINLLFVPLHYYTPIKNIKNIQKNKLLKKIEFSKINFNKNKSISFLKSMQKQILIFKNRNVYEKLHNNKNSHGPGYGKIESIILQSVINKKKIKRVLEIGSGISTFCILDSLNISNNINYKVMCIEPNPSDSLLNLAKEEKIRLIKKNIEEVPTKKILDFRADFLFIDTTHTVKPLSDVEFIYTRILPNIKNCIIHIHDIYFPYLYQNDLHKKSYMQWSETMLLYCYLLNNKKTKIILSMPHIFHENKNIFKELFKSWKLAKFRYGLQKNLWDNNAHFPSSVYLQQ